MTRSSYRVGKLIRDWILVLNFLLGAEYHQNVLHFRRYKFPVSSFVSLLDHVYE